MEKIGMKRALVVAAFFILLQTHLWAAEWGKQEVSVGGWPHNMTIKMDSQDQPRVVLANTRGMTTYGYRVGTTWHFQDIVDQDVYSSMKIGSDDRTRVAYIDYPNGDLYYGEWDGSSWNLQIAAHPGIGMRLTDLALDSANNPYIVYCTRPLYTDILNLAKWNGSAWVLSTVESGIMAGWAALAVDSSNNPHILYFDNSTPHSIKYASWNGATWDIEVVDTGGGDSYEDTLIIDSSDVPHVAFTKYRGGAGLDLVYAVKTGGTWDKKVVEAA